MTDTHPGPTLARIRKARGLTRPQLAAATGVPVSVIRDIEQARAGNGHMGTLAVWMVDA